MEQRPLRLGDVVDDYCPRERRITNHAIVALVDEVIHKTRCTTCESEHVYKSAKVPRRRKKEAEEPLDDQAAAEAMPSQLVPPGDADPAVEPAEAASAAQATPPDVEPPQAASHANPGDVEETAEVTPETPADDEPWFGHRRLIRATLPRSETDEPEPRPIPEFTMHQRQPQGRGRHGQGNGPQHGGGQPRNGFRQGRSGQGQPDGNQADRPNRGGSKSGRRRHRRSR